MFVGNEGFLDMEAFPFTEAEWADVKDATLLVINATLSDDRVLHASHRIGLFDVLEALKTRYGNHPVLLETKADFTADDEECTELYLRAIHIAEEYSLPTLSIRLSLSRLLLDGDNILDAKKQLLVCEGELDQGDPYERASWEEMINELKHTR